jgi:hypothetical protein
MTLAGFAYRKVGIRKGTRGLLFVAQYGIVRQKDGMPVTMDRYAEWWHMSTATAYRDREAFEAVFGDASVEAVWQVVRQGVGKFEARDADDRIGTLVDVQRFPAWSTLL